MQQENFKTLRITEDSATIIGENGSEIHCTFDQIAKILNGLSLAIGDSHEQQGGKGATLQKRPHIKFG